MRPLLLLTALFLSASGLQAQTAASVNWSLTEADGLSVTSNEGVATGAMVRSQTIVARDYTGTLSDGSSGPLGPYQRWYLGGAEWPVETGPDPARYVEFVAAPEAGAQMTVTAIDFVMNAGGTGEMDASVFIDTDPAFGSPTALEVAIDVSRDAVGTFSYTTDEMLASGDSLYLRIYPWLGGGNPSAGRYLFLQNMTISGEEVEEEEVAVEGVFWALTEADTTAVTATASNLGGARVRSSVLTVRDYTGDLRDAGDAVGPLGPFQRWWLDGADWPDESAPDPTRYVEFAAGAEPGFGFAVDSIAVYIHGDGTSAMNAQVAYSTSADFSNPTVLAEALAAGDGDFGGPTLQVFEFAETVTDSIYVRIYPWVRSSSIGSGRYLLLQAMGIYGTAQVDTAIEGAPEASGVTLYPSAPNPVRSSAAVRFSLAEAGDVDLAVVDLLGRRVATLARGPHAAGAHAATFRADGLASGVYVLQVRSGETVATQRIVVAQ